MSAAAKGKSGKALGERLKLAERVGFEPTQATCENPQGNPHKPIESTVS
jgi:hypothetical protein